MAQLVGRAIYRQAHGETKDAELVEKLQTEFAPELAVYMAAPEMKKEEARPLNESEREELIRLRAENEYIKAENEVIKKEIALREERHAAQLKARKQRSSKSCVKKDTN